MPAPSPLPDMSNAAFAGFLRLMLTPLNEAPEPNSELRAYLDYLSTACPRDAGALPDIALPIVARSPAQPSMVA